MSCLSIRSATSSLRNHIFFIWVYFSLPMSLFTAALTYQDAKLTLIRILWILTVCTSAGVILALVGWYVIVPLIRRRSGRRDT
jgi:hypothetical protein